MHISPLQILATVPAAATAASVGYCILGIVAEIRFSVQRRRAPVNDTTKLPLVSILKPLKGADPELYEALRSHCVQNYPEYEILFGVTEPADPAATVVEKLMREFPHRKIRLILCDKRLGANGKVSSLIRLAAAASAEHFLVNDSDIRVETDYLRTVMSELDQPKIGLVTCLYRGTPGRSLGSRLEALGISTDFMPGVLAADLIEGGVHFGLGSTLAFRRSDLEAIGGFEAIVDYLADDYELGHRISKRKPVQLSRSIVKTHLPDYDLRGFVSHQLRWARTIRASRPGGYAGLLLTFTLPWAVAALCVSQNLTAWILLAAALVARTTLALLSSRLVLHEKKLSSLWLLPVRDVIAAMIWFGGLLGNKIAWRGERFVLRQGRLQRLP